MPTCSAIAAAVRALSPVIIGHLQPHGVQLMDHVDGVVLDRVSHREHTHHLAVPADEHRGAAELF